jgi:hypothetical protein
MANRFGRNQRRKLREELAAVTRDGAQALAMERRARRQEREKLEADIAAARRAQDTVRITVDAILDPRENALQMRARFEMYRREPVYSALEVRERDIIDRSTAERCAFIKHAGEIVAEHGLAQIVRHWRSR